MGEVVFVAVEYSDYGTRFWGSGFNVPAPALRSRGCFSSCRCDTLLCVDIRYRNPITLQVRTPLDTLARMSRSPHRQGIKTTSPRTRAVRPTPPNRGDDQDLYGGLIRLHVLHHAAQEPVFGLWLIEELRRHGYRISPGTLYPILHSLEGRGLLRSGSQRERRTVRRMYSATAKGRRTLQRAKGRVRELFGEMLEDEEVK
jgi:PadR family transcriptional regulator, regulatory protein PadR